MRTASERWNGVRDTDLLAQLQAGDEDALAPLMARHERRLYGIAYGYLRNSEDALEVVQDAFVKLFQQSERVDTRAEVGAWLTRVAINAAIDRYRQKKRRGTREVEVENEDLQHIPSRREAGPLDNLHTEDSRRELERGLRALNETQRAVVTLRHFSELSLDEIASTLGVRLGTVKSSLNRALARMKTAMGEARA
ncbi:MAG: RNA polymerase sigma factor [Vicinamibacteria bacterium]